MKRTLVILALVLVVVVAAGSWTRFYLHSNRVTKEVTDQLEAFYGGTLDVGNVNIGVRGTTLKDLVFYEKGGDAKNGFAWLKISEISVDLSLWNLLRGEDLPRHAKIDGLTLTLRFNRMGELETEFPNPSSTTGEPVPDLPEVTIENGTVILHKDGVGDLTVQDLKAHCVNENGRWVMRGTCNQNEFALIDLQGIFDKASSQAHVELKNQTKGHFTQALLDRLPFVPPFIWQEIQLKQGDALAGVNVDYDLRKKSVRYKVDVQAEKTELFVPSLALPAQDTAATLIVEDNVLQLRKAHGTAFGGNFRTEAELDFRKPVLKLQVSSLAVENVNLSEVPPQWNIPVLVRKALSRGKLYADASLDISMAAVKPNAGYAGTVWAAATLPPALGPSPWLAIAAFASTVPDHEVDATSQGKGEVRDPSGKTEPIQFDWQLTPRGSDPSKAVMKTSRAPAPHRSWTPSLLTALLLLTTASVSDVDADDGTLVVAQAPSFGDMKFHLKNVNLAEFVQNLGVKLPFPVEGKASIDVKAFVPIDRPNDFKSYRAEGSAKLSQFVFGGLKLDEVDAEFSYNDGMLYLKTFRARLAVEPGKKESPWINLGSAQMRLVPFGALQADFNLDRIPVNSFGASAAENVQGTVSAKLRIRASDDKFEGVESLSMDGKLSGEGLKLFGHDLDQFSSTIQVQKGVLKLPDVFARFDGNPITASAGVQLSGDFHYLARAKLRDWNLAFLHKLDKTQKPAPTLSTGTVGTDIALEGKLLPGKGVYAGDVTVSHLKADRFEAPDLTFHWDTDGKKFDLSSVNAQLYGGTLNGTAVIPFDTKQSGKVDLQVKGLDAAKLTLDLYSPVRMEGKVDGNLRGSFPLSGPETSFTLEMDLKAPMLRVQNVPTEQIQGKLEYRKGALEYKLQGRTLGGTFDLEGEAPAKASPDNAKDARKGKLTIQNVRLSRFAEAYRLRGAPVSGLLNLHAEYTQDSLKQMPKGTGVVRLTNVRTNGNLLSEEIRGDVLWSDEGVRIRDLQGTLAGGTIDGLAFYNVRQPQRSYFTLNVDAAESTALLGPWFGNKIEGPFGARIRGSLADGWSGSAEVDFARGKVYGLDVTQARLPASWSFSPGEGRGRFEIYEFGASVARGRASGKVSLLWQDTAHVEGNLRLDRVDVQALIRPFSPQSQIAGGQFTGRFDFSGNEVRSVNDISGTIVGSFKQAQALQVPILSQAAPLLGMGPSTTFQNGDLRARLDRGTIRLQKFNAEGGTYKLFVDGTLTLAGALNLSVLAKTGDVGLPSVRLGPISLRIPLAGPVPLVLVSQASALLSNQLVYVQVTGTIHNPVIQPRPLPLLSQEAVRYFLSRAALPVTIDQ